MIILAQLYIVIVTLLLAGKDATSFLLKERNDIANSLYYKRIDRWHRDGVSLFILLILPLCYFISGWLALYGLLIRLAFFDIAFNKWAGLHTNFLGSTSIFDKIFSSIFGNRGAVKKSLFFLAILIALNILI